MTFPSDLVFQYERYVIKPQLNNLERRSCSLISSVDFELCQRLSTCNILPLIDLIWYVVILKLAVYCDL